MKELVSRIKAVLRRRSSGNYHSKRLLSGDIEILLEERAFSKSKVQLQITPIEANILLILIQNPMMILTRERLLSNIWDVDGEFINDICLHSILVQLKFCHSMLNAFG